MVVLEILSKNNLKAFSWNLVIYFIEQPLLILNMIVLLQNIVEVGMIMSLKTLILILRRATNNNWIVLGVCMKYSSIRD